MSAIERNAEKLTADLKRVIHDSEDLLRATGEAFGDKTEEVRVRLKDSLDCANRTCRALEQRAVRGAKQADALVRDHPYQSIGIAVGLGLLLGGLLSRKIIP